MDLQALQKKIDDFATEREWRQFHTPKNLSMALNVEASELLEIFQWLTPEDSFRVCDEKNGREAVSDEISDIMVYALRLAYILNIDVEKAIENKMKKNATKYPVEKCKGKSNKYSEYKE